MDQSRVSSFTDEHRQMFVRLLEEARDREESESDPDSDDEDEVEAEAVSRLAKEKGASKLVAKIRRFKRNLEEAEEALGNLGFQCDESGIELRYDAPKDLKQAVRAAKRAAKRERNKALRKYDHAIAGVLAANDASSANKIVEALL